jgi:hypothetical protein
MSRRIVQIAAARGIGRLPSLAIVDKDGAA